MGVFYTDCVIQNHIYPRKSAAVSRVLVDTGSECTWISERTLQSIGLIPAKKNLQLVMANGTILTRSIAYAIVRVGNHQTIDEIVFAKDGDFEILGARTMEGLGLRIDPRLKQLVWAGPRLAAAAA